MSVAPLLKITFSFALDKSVLETFISADFSPLILNNIKYAANSDLLFSINGEKSADIKVSKTDFAKVKEKVTFNNGATDKALIIAK